MGVYISLDSFRCHVETSDGLGSDEPYMIVATVDRTAATPIRTFRYGPFANVDAQENHLTGFQTIWGMNGEDRLLNNPDDAIFLVCIIENDSDLPDLWSASIWQAVSGAFSAVAGLDRPTQVTRLATAMDRARPGDGPGAGSDDKVGSPREVRFSGAEIRSRLISA